MPPVAGQPVPEEAPSDEASASDEPLRYDQPSGGSRTLMPWLVGAGVLLLAGLGFLLVLLLTSDDGETSSAPHPTGDHPAQVLVDHVTAWSTVER
ncbi:hypothetical protein ABC795_06175 [Blastococcus sp. HT6-30]|uniref:hypothetical protein n=1 Tax=Blastococcus sp. HT6-30 TaxID=3144843 RepID=UPI003219E1FA